MALVWKHLPEQACYAAEGIAYCDRPQAAHLQRMNIYIPEAYLNADGTASAGAELVTKHGARYTAATVPVVFYNDIGGYAECEPAGLIQRNFRYLKDGYVLVSVGARGRQSRDAQGAACGKAPAGLVDLKAAVRWLRAHAEELPAGDLSRIVSVGTSAGGAMSSLLALSGDCAAFEPYLAEIGAAQGVSDAIWAAQCYCPIMDLEHADMAYEWMFGAKAVCTMKAQTNPVVLDAFQCILSQRLAQSYPVYINSLGLDVSLGEDGRSGSFYTELMGAVSDSLNTFLARHAASIEEQKLLVDELDAGAGFIAWDGERATITDLDAYVRAYIGRKKACPAFDPFNGGSPENQEFGLIGATEGSAQDKVHFSAATGAHIRALASTVDSAEYSDLAAAYELDRAQSGQDQKVALLNPLTYLGLGEGRKDPERFASTKPEHMRIRLGSRDADHAFAASFTLYQAIKQQGIDVNYGLIWGTGHCDADYPGEFSEWVDGLMAKA